LEPLLYETRAFSLFWKITDYGDVKETFREMVCLSLNKPELMRQHNRGLPAGVMLWEPLGSNITMSAEACAKQSGASFHTSFGKDMLGTPVELKVAFDSAIHEAPCVLFVSDCECLAQAGARVIRIANEIKSRQRQAGSEPG